MAADTLASALVEAQKAMPAVEPDATNPHFKTKFVSLDHLIAKTRPVLNKHGLAIVQMPSHTEDGRPTLATIIYHASSGQSVQSDTLLLLNGKNDMQSLGAAITYARRYAWAAALGIAGDEDDDGESATRTSSLPSGSVRDGDEGAPAPKKSQFVFDPKKDLPSATADQQTALTRLLTTLVDAKKITAVQFLSACQNAGAKAGDPLAAITELSEPAAKDLIVRLAKLEKRQEQAA